MREVAVVPEDVPDPAPPEPRDAPTCPGAEQEGLPRGVDTAAATLTALDEDEEKFGPPAAPDEGAELPEPGEGAGDKAGMLGATSLPLGTKIEAFPFRDITALSGLLDVVDAGEDTGGLVWLCSFLQEVAGTPTCRGVIAEGAGPVSESVLQLT